MPMFLSRPGELRIIRNASSLIDPPWPLTVALSSIEAELWSTTRFSAAGFIEPQDDDRVRFEVHTVAATGAAVLHRDQLQPGATARLRELWQLGPVISTACGSGR